MAAKTFREWWDAQGPIDYQVDIRSAEFGWNAAKRAEVDKPARNMPTTPPLMCECCKTQPAVMNICHDCYMAT